MFDKILKINNNFKKEWYLFKEFLWRKKYFDIVKIKEKFL